MKFDSVDFLTPCPSLVCSVSGGLCEWNMGSLWVAWEQLSSAWERKQPVHFCCTIQLAFSCTDKEPHRSFLKPVVLLSVRLFSIRSIFNTGSVLRRSPGIQKGNNNSSNSSTKVGVRAYRKFSFHSPV